MAKFKTFIRRSGTGLAILTAIGLLLSACTGGTDQASLSSLLKLDVKRLTFVYFYSPG